MNFFSWITGGQSEEEAAANIARQTELLRQQAIRNNTVSETEKFLANVGGVESVIGAYGEGFQEGLSEGRSNIDGAIFGTLKTIFKSVPWFVWLGVGIGIFFWLGGFAMLAKKGKGVLAKG